MDDVLKTRIARLRVMLEKDDDPSIGFLAPPARRPVFPQDIPEMYRALLREADGAVCGTITLYESDEVLQHQDDADALPGDSANWFCFGAIDDKPLWLDLRHHTVHLVNPEEDFDPDESLGEFHYFLQTCVFGDGYAEFAAEPDDGWLEFLRRHP